VTSAFIKLTDMAPLAVAYELDISRTKGVVTLSSAGQTGNASGRFVIGGQLDGALCWTGQPLRPQRSGRYGTKAHIITALFDTLNGGPTPSHRSNDIWEDMTDVPTMDGWPSAASRISPQRTCAGVASCTKTGQPFTNGHGFSWFDP